MTLTRRLIKGSRLTNAEGDANVDHFDTKTADGWKDLPVPISTDPTAPNSPTWGFFRGGQRKRLFPAGELTEFDGELHINHDYKLGTPIYLHVHWTPTDITVGTVRWGFEYSAAKGHQQQGFPATTTVYVEQTTLGNVFADADRAHMIAEVDVANVIPPTNLEVDSVITLRIFRDGGHVNDTYTQSVFCIFADAHHEVDRLSTPNKAPNFYTA